MSDNQQWDEDEQSSSAPPTESFFPPPGPPGAPTPPDVQPPEGENLGGARYQPPTYQPPTSLAPPAGGYQQPGQPQYQPGQQQYQQPGQAGHEAQPLVAADGTGEGSQRNLGRFGVIAAIVVVGLLGAAGAFALSRSLSGPAGADTPDEAAAQFFSALDNEDFLAVAEIALPSEREALLEPSSAIALELARLELLSDGFVDDGGNVQGFFGIELSIPAAGEPGALEYEVLQPVGGSEDIQWVTVTEGLVTATFDPQELRNSLGDRVTDWIEDNEPGLDDQSTETEVIDWGQAFDQGEPFEFAVVQEDGGYFVSLIYTIAGFANDKQPPPLDLAPTPVGSDSAEQAAIDFLDNLLSLNAQGVLTMMDPREFRAAYDYWGTYSPEFTRDLNDVRNEAAAEGVSWELVSAQTSADDRNGRKVVTFDEVVVAFANTNPSQMFDLTATANGQGMTIEGTIQGSPATLTVTQEMVSGSATIDGESFAAEFNFVTYEGWLRVAGDETTISRQGDCFVVANNGVPESLCGDELGLAGAEDLFDFQQDYTNAFADAGPPGLTVVERDGRWYVSGYPTLAYLGVDYLAALDTAEFEELINSYEEFLESTMGGF